MRFILKLPMQKSRRHEVIVESGAVPPAFGFRVRARHLNYARLHLIPLGSCPNNRSHCYQLETSKPACLLNKGKIIAGLFRVGPVDADRFVL